MVKQLIRLSFACVVALSLCGVASAHQRYDQGPQGANAYGFRNGYLDGFQHGSEDRGAQVDFNMESRDYDSAMRGYDPYMGNQELYRNGYRQGYAAGYNDGYYGRESRFEGRAGSPPYPSGEAYEEHQGPRYGPANAAFQTGFNDGVIQGEKDRRKHKDFRPEKNDRYEDADHGYSHDFGPKQLYKRQYREGFMAGYQHGYRSMEMGWNR
ncbi:MAG TPA: hypothetical protein VFZ27_19310 [Terriglobia bacterium]|nr:hypothetical protein [Terriglobia bacterium]